MNTYNFQERYTERVQIVLIRLRLCSPNYIRQFVKIKILSICKLLSL